ncbi:MAG: TIGR01777 family protein [Bacteroidetes bacterium]|nr:MAG: TIGR01777 family protein [Bacteroidota bacterium]
MDCIVLIAGGTGFLGQELKNHFTKAGWKVRILTRNKKKTFGKAGFHYWDPSKEELDEKALEGVTHLINLCGSGIADKRWTSSRKRELLNSRIEPAAFLRSKAALMPELQLYISASGINCFDTSSEQHYTEKDSMGTDFLSDLVSKWEEEAQKMEVHCPVLIWRIPMVIANGKGALKKMEEPLLKGFGAILGSGEQRIPWVHISDLLQAFEFGIKQQLKGIYHVNAGTTSLGEIMRLLARKNKKRLLPFRVPRWVVFLIFGEMASLLLEGISASSEKLISEGFHFQQKELPKNI